MQRFFVRLAPGFYRASGAPLRSEQDGDAWAQEYAEMLGRGEPFFMLVDGALSAELAADRRMRAWIQAQREQLARMVKLVVVVAENIEQRLALRWRDAAGAPYPVRVATNYAEAFDLCARTALRNG